MCENSEQQQGLGKFWFSGENPRKQDMKPVKAQ